MLFYNDLTEKLQIEVVDDWGNWWPAYVVNTVAMSGVPMAYIRIKSSHSVQTELVSFHKSEPILNIRIKQGDWDLNKTFPETDPNYQETF